MDVTERKTGDVIVLDLSGTLTRDSGALNLEARMKDLLNSGECRFVFDMLDVPYIDTGGIAATIACYRWAREKRSVVKLVLNRKGEKLFLLLKFDHVFEIFDDVETALASFETISSSM